MQGGTYCLIIHLDKEVEIRVGQLGAHTYKPGFYVYVGSALNGLKSRIDRHKSSNPLKKKHWHIDYLLEHAVIVDVVSLTLDLRIECEVSRRVCSLNISHVPVSGFGSSDCSCASHLYSMGPDISSWDLKSTLAELLHYSALSVAGKEN